MKIFLVYPVINVPQDTGYNYGLGYISAVLKENGFDVRYFVIRKEKEIVDFYEKIKLNKPKLIAFSVTSSQYNLIKKIVKNIKKISDSFVVYGGYYPTLKPECIFEVPELDAIVRGEGEYPMLELVYALKNKKNYLNIKNLWVRKNNKIIKNKIRPLIKNLDELPFPDKTSLNYQKVIDKAGGVNRFIFSRGCIFDCTYCANPALKKLYVGKGNYFRKRSPEKAIKEIEIDSRKFKFKSITIDDDTITLDKKWFYKFFTLYKKKFNYPFRCNIRIDTIDEDMIRLLKEANARDIGVGIEHGNEGFRRKILKRNISNKQIINIYRLLDKYKISHKDFIMVGFPFETKKLFFDTVKLCRKVKARGHIAIFHPYPGTELAKICEKNKWHPQKDKFKEREEAVITYPNFSKQQIQLCADVFPLLIQLRFIPLSIPLKPLSCLYKSLKALKNFLHFKNP